MAPSILKNRGAFAGAVLGVGRNKPITTFLVLMVGAIILVAGAGLLELRGQAEQDRQMQLALSDLGRQSNLLSSLEWQALAEPGESDEVGEEAASVIAEMETIEAGLLESDPSEELTRSLALAATFRDGVGDEFDAISRGDFERVEEIDAQVVDPAFGQLQPALDGLIEVEEEAASRSSQQASIGSILYLVLAALVLLANQAARSRRRLLEARTVTLYEQAHKDPLTGLSNRRELLADLDESLDSTEESVLALLDLNGFKAYNDRFGHVEGDLLLHRLAGKLAVAVAPAGRAYRLGGDEFCVLWRGSVRDREARLEAATTALGEEGEGFHITAAQGAAVLPAEAKTSAAALRLVDRRMYESKPSRHFSSKRQVRDVVMRALEEVELDLHAHVRYVAYLALETGRQLGIEGEALRDLTYAAELHDVGKMAIPDAVLGKPGPLDPEELEFVRRHTLIGEAILGEAPALKTVSRYVRFSHERFDGQGYPDGLSGTEIPLPSRVIFVCDAFSAMTEPRPYRSSMTVGEARDELRLNAGTQFDPAAVEALCAVLDQAEKEPVIGGVGSDRAGSRALPPDPMAVRAPVQP